MLPGVDELLVYPAGFPEGDFPADNEFTAARWELGRKLFFDPAMSRDFTKSCASCHAPARAFSDNVALSLGVEDRIGTRNSPPLFNLIYHPSVLRDGALPTLEMQVLVPIQEHNEFDFNILLIQDRLRADPEYERLSLEAYDRLPDPFTITRSLATFQRSLLSGNSRYDQFLRGEISLSEREMAGKDLFFSSRTNCSSCHGDFNFTDYRFANNGLYETYADPGRFRITGLEKDRAVFKVPSLRNLGFTAPYMHDGSFENLAEVIAHYNSGGEAHPNKDDLIQPLMLTDAEQLELEAFLRTLNDFDFINNPLFRP